MQDGSECRHDCRCVRTTSAQRLPVVVDPPLRFSTVEAPDRFARPSSLTAEKRVRPADDGPDVTMQTVAPPMMPQVGAPPASEDPWSPAPVCPPGAVPVPGRDQGRLGPNKRVGAVVARIGALRELFAPSHDGGEDERPLGALDEVRLQSARIGVASTVAVLVVLFLYAVIP